MPFISANPCDLQTAPLMAFDAARGRLVIVTVAASKVADGARRFDVETWALPATSPKWALLSRDAEVSASALPLAITYDDMARMPLLLTVGACHPTSCPSTWYEWCTAEAAAHAHSMMGSYGLCFVDRCAAPPMQAEGTFWLSGASWQLAAAATPVASLGPIAGELYATMEPYYAVACASERVSGLVLCADALGGTVAAWRANSRVWAPVGQSARAPPGTLIQCNERVRRRWVTAQKHF